MAQNTIKVKQIDNDELSAFLQSTLGITVAGSSSTYSYIATFGGPVNFQSSITTSGTSLFSGQATFQSGIVSNSGVYVNGVISGRSVIFDTFNLNSGAANIFRIGGFLLTGIPVFNSGLAGLGAILPSGTVFGVRQTINAPLFEYDNQGNIQPTLSGSGLSGLSIVMLCVSMGS